MASKRSKGNTPEMIHCEYCGEDYSSTYKHCPFCDEMEADEDYDYDEYDDAPRNRGGKRLVTNTRGGGYGGGPSPLKIIGTVISLALIIAAVVIVISIIMPLVSKGNVPDPNVPVASESVEPTASPEDTSSPEDTTPPAAESPEDTIPADQTATGFTLDKTEFSFSDRWPDPIALQVSFIPAGSTGSITWTSSDPEIASVDETGKVSHGTKKGKATITATMAGGVTQSCEVYNQVTNASSGSSTSSGSSLSLNREDFTLERGQAFQVKVSGTSSTPTWSIGNTSVATVSGDGTVKYVGKGQTKLTCTVDGKTLTCIVRCN